jgi:hypothetical protein
MVINNKKGVIRIIEAAISIVLIAIVLVMIYSQQTSTTNKANQISQMQREILDQIRNTDSLRNAVLIEDNPALDEFVSNSLSSIYDFEIKACSIDLSCPRNISKGQDKEIYVEETLVTGNLTAYNPKKVKLFVWEK